MDKIEKLRESTIQHGALNNRIYLMKLSRVDMPSIIRDLNSVAYENGYTKIFTRVPSTYEDFFEEDGYIKEASISGFFNDLTDASFMSKFPDKKRTINTGKSETEKNLTLALSKSNSGFTPSSGYDIGRAGPEDAAEIAGVYGEVFETYPFPIQDEQYIIETMKENIIYFKAVIDGKIAAVSSAETYPSWQAVEMTDFATLPAHRGKSLASMLLAKMEEEMKDSSFLTSYTIARALSPGMNLVFSKAGYGFNGTLVNNTNISGSIQNMNVWSKKL